MTNRFNPKIYENCASTDHSTPRRSVHPSSRLSSVDNHYQCLHICVDQLLFERQPFIL